MRTLKLGFVMVLAAAAASGCANDEMADDGGGGGGGGGDPQPPPEPPKPLDATGSYRLHSTFDIAQNMPGAVGDAVNGFISATDDPDDPMSWVVTNIIAAMPDGFMKDLLVSAEPFISSELNDQLIELAPDLVTTMLRIGHGLEDVTERFGLAEQLDVTMNDGAYVGTVTADGMEFTIENQPMSLPFVDYDLENVVAAGVPVHNDATNTFGIGRHRLPLAYGKILRIAVDAAIIPLIDSNASNLGELLGNMVDCQAVGQKLADAIGFGGPSLWAGACVTGLDFAADQLYDQLAGIDSSALEFQVDGKAKSVDGNSDTRIDRLDTGVWTGVLSYSGTDAELGPSTFVGARQ